MEKVGQARETKTRRLTCLHPHDSKATRASEFERAIQLQHIEREGWQVLEVPGETAAGSCSHRAARGGVRQQLCVELHPHASEKSKRRMALGSGACGCQ